MTLSYTSRADAWAEAVSTHHHLLVHGRLTSVPAPVPALLREPGEYAVAVIPGGMQFARFDTAPVSYAGGTSFVAGSLQFMTGYLVTDLILRDRRRRRAQRAAAAQWRPSPLSRVVVTTRRLWCEIATKTRPRWLNFDHDTITELHLHDNALTLAFLQAEPLLLAGDLAPWCAAVIAHYRFGVNAPAVVPALHAAMPAS